jgi:hypothetical protein
MDRYFVIENSTDHKIIGSEFPQCIGTVKGYNDEYENPLSLYYFAHHKGKQIDFTPDLSAIRIGLKTKLTDSVSCSLGPGNDWVISSKFKNLLKPFITSPLQLFQCVLNRKEERFTYWWVHYIYDLEKQVNYTQSSFTHPDEKLLPKLAKIKTYEDYRLFYEQEDEYGLIRATKTVLNSPPLDFFLVGQFNQQHYISERLRDEMQLKGLKGITYKEAADIVFTGN